MHTNLFPISLLVMIAAMLALGLTVAIIGTRTINAHKQAPTVAQYHKDTRTNLCFAYFPNTLSGNVIQVPCEEVKDYLEK